MHIELLYFWYHTRSAYVPTSLLAAIANSLAALVWSWLPGCIKQTPSSVCAWNIRRTVSQGSHSSVNKPLVLDTYNMNMESKYEKRVQ